VNDSKESASPSADEPFKELVDTIDAIVCEYDLRTRQFTYISEQGERILGYPHDVLEHEGWRPMGQALLDRTDDSYEHRVRAVDDREVWLSVRASAVLDDAGEPALIRTVSLDVTSLKEAEAERERSLSLLQATLDSTGDAIVVVDLDNRIIARNEAFAELWSIPQGLLDAHDRDAITASVLDRVADPDEFVRRLAELAQDRAMITTDVFELADGRWIERHTTPHWLGGEVVGRVWTFRDITEKLAAQDALRDSEQRYRATFENIALIAAGIDRHGIITFANDPLLKLTGWSREEVVGHDWFELFDDNPYVRADYVERMELGEIRPRFDGTIRTRSGERRDIHWSSTVQYDESGAATGITTIGEDVTEQHRADALLRNREELFRSLIENASDVITILAADGTSLYESPSVERVLGWTPEEIVGRPSFALLHEDDLARVQEMFASTLAGEEPGAQEFRLRHRDGSWRTVEAIGRRRRQEGEWVVVVNYRDVTQQRELQEQLLHSQKLEAVGRLAGGVAHDFNNLLTAIGGYSEFLAAGFEADDPRRDDALEIVRASARGAALTAQLLAFSRRQVMLSEVLELGDVVLGLKSLLSRLLGEGVELSTSVEPGCLVRADRGQLEQVITNLALNARDAMPSGGTVELVVRRLERAVELCVSDTGFGMDADTTAHAFEPFFTTKDDGTGFGLATVYGIVKQSDGHIWLYSEPGAGTTFKLYFPIRSDGERVAPAPEPVAVGVHGTETILLVEDEDLLRPSVARALEARGYTVIAAANAQEALVRAWSHPAIDLLITDVVMPGLNGRELAERLLQEHPTLRVIYTSGYPADTVLRYGIEHGLVTFLQKPYLPDDLAGKARALLDEAP
jgi:PAS domain S-box-containing protein